MKVICINDQGRPNEVPASKWIKKNEEYTIIEWIKCNPQGGLLGVKIAEIDLTGCEPYLYFAANRFAPLVPDEMLEEELNEIMVI
jgi:hypothetical protein